MTHLNRMRERLRRRIPCGVTGGPAHSDIWMGKADVSGLRIELPQIEETGCFWRCARCLRRHRRLFQLQRRPTQPTAPGAHVIAADRRRAGELPANTANTHLIVSTTGLPRPH